MPRCYGRLTTDIDRLSRIVVVFFICYSCPTGFEGLCREATIFSTALEEFTIYSNIGKYLLAKR